MFVHVFAHSSAKLKMIQKLFCRRGKAFSIVGWRAHARHDLEQALKLGHCENIATELAALALDDSGANCEDGAVEGTLRLFILLVLAKAQKLYGTEACSV